MVLVHQLEVLKNRIIPEVCKLLPGPFSFHAENMAARMTEGSGQPQKLPQIGQSPTGYS